MYALFAFTVSPEMRERSCQLRQTIATFAALVSRTRAQTTRGVMHRSFSEGNVLMYGPNNDGCYTMG